MRFEIRTGGVFVILLGLLGLSGAVFLLGLFTGDYMARQTQPDLNQISSAYPLPSPPEKPAPVSEMSSAAVASPAVASAPAPALPSVKPPAPAVVEAPPPAARTSPATVARLKPPPEPAVNRPAPDNEPDTGDESETESPPPPPAPVARGLAPGAKPYNIQIEAVMDKSGADEMVARLKSLGYNAQETKMALNGGTWYRVHVGPYASAEEATVAQNRLREQYKQAYSTTH